MESVPGTLVFGFDVGRTEFRTDIPALASDLARLNVHTHRGRRLASSLIGQVRARHGLS